jgi:hypothetical protein
MNKILCFLGFHKWSASIKDYIEEFGFIPLDGRIATNSVCKRCNKKYYNQTYNQKQHIIDIMKADEDDGLYNQIN